MAVGTVEPPQVAVALVEVLGATGHLTKISGVI